MIGLSARRLSLARWSREVRISAGRSFAKATGVPTNLLGIHALCVQGQVADLHVLDHATAKRAHRRLLSEIDSAAWRRRIVAGAARC
jgi:N-acyl-D-aspartate/D-glutamate deacylase